MESKIVINEKPLFLEAWHEGSVHWDGEEYKFWIINPVRIDPKEHEYELEVRWFFKSVPREVRMMYNEIIEKFKHDAAIKSNH